jgi:DNA-binding transcriptional MerR regulator
MSTMRSKEVAELASVSVRTLRHYHQIGVLPEPERGPNGYRNYELSHVALLLRIRRLAALGISLESMPPYLDPIAGGDRDELLADLDRELEGRIARLSEQRDRIAQLRNGRQRPDLPPGLDVFVGLLGAEPHPVADLEQDAALVLAQLSGDSYEADVRKLGESVVHADEHGGVTRFVTRFRELSPGATEGEIEQVVSDFTVSLGPALTAYLASPSGRAVRQTRPGAVPTIDDDPRLNEPQARALAMIAAHLEAAASEADTADVATKRTGVR